MVFGAGGGVGVTTGGAGDEVESLGILSVAGGSGVGVPGIGVLLGVSEPGGARVGIVVVAPQSCSDMPFGQQLLSVQ